MIKLPKEIKKLLSACRENGGYAYIVDQSLKDSILEIEPETWEILTDVSGDVLKRILPEGNEISERLFKSKIGISKDQNSKAEKDVEFRRYNGSIEDYIEEKIIGADAVAYDGENLIDPYDGYKDIKNEVIKLLYDPDEMFRENPLAMLDAIQAAADTNFDITKKLGTSIERNASLLKSADKKVLTDRFTKLLVSRYTGKGLQLLDRCGLLAVLVGERIYKGRKKKEKQAFELYKQHVDQTMRIEERRIVSFYLGFWKNNDVKAMDNLAFDPALRAKLVFAHKHLSDMHYMNNAVDLKDYLYKYGLEAYKFVDDIAKIQTRVYGLDTSPIGKRFALMNNIIAKEEPVFLEDLSMNSEVLIAEGLAKDQKDAEKMLDMLVHVVHRHPEYNEPVKLLSQAYRINKNVLRKLKYKSYGHKL